jgi:hypothetical protein
LSEMKEDAIVEESMYTVSSLYFSFGMKKVNYSEEKKSFRYY